MREMSVKIPIGFAVIQAVLAGLFWSTSADALTVNGTLRFWDSRSYRSTNTGSRLTNSGLTNVGLKNANVSLMDRDGLCLDSAPGCEETDDDLLAATLTNGTGGFTFSGINEESDVYVEFGYAVHSQHSIRDEEGLPVVTRSTLVNNATGTITINFNATCTDESKNNVQGFCDAPDVMNFFSDQENYANIIASMEAAESYVNPPPTTAYWPDTPDNDCAGTATALIDSFCIIDGANNHEVVHEIGHLIHQAALGITTRYVLLLGGGCSAAEYVGSEANEKCVTAEGFASFVAGATWWAQNSVNPEFFTYDLEGDTHAANTTGQPCVGFSSQPHRRSGNVARFFWDLYDSTTVGASDSIADDANLNFSTVNGVWFIFGNGTTNRKNRESGAHGRNVEDYVAMAAALTFDFTLERDLNCLDDQVD